mmetsp:Transcript_23152/g.54132  ORF Transcript_23152/g.54132 Transcript_23152/m.54132 type:complete len:492 (+) Transcript_23152:80-1555(+)
MLEPKYFEQLNIGRQTDGRGRLFEAYRPLGHPVVLFSLVDGAPLAALTLRCQDGRTHALITKRPSSGDKLCDFQGLIADDAKDFELVISNLSHAGYINFNVLKTQVKVDCVDPGPGIGINQINELAPGQSIVVQSDQETNCSLVLRAIRAQGSEEMVSVGQDEASAAADNKTPKGTYFFLSVVPDASSLELVKQFASTKWACVDWFSLSRPCPDSDRGRYGRPRAASYGLGDFGVRGGGRGGGHGHHGRPARRSRSRSRSRSPPREWRERDRSRRRDRSRSRDRGCSRDPDRDRASACDRELFRSCERDDRSSLLKPTKRKRREVASLSEADSLGGSGPLAEEPAQEADAIMSSFAAQVSTGRHIHVDSYDTGRTYQYDSPAAPCMLGLSVLLGLRVESCSPKELEAEAREAVRSRLVADGVTSSAGVVAKLTAVFPEGECVVCLEDHPDCVFYSCGHQCTHMACARGLPDRTCPLCRSHIAARVRLSVVP